jgi:hypothetical protein
MNHSESLHESREEPGCVVNACFPGGYLAAGAHQGAVKQAHIILYQQEKMRRQGA